MSKIVVCTVAYPPNGEMIVDAGTLTIVLSRMDDEMKPPQEIIAKFLEWEIGTFVAEKSHPTVMCKGVRIDENTITVLIEPWTRDVEEFFSQDMGHTVNLIAKSKPYIKHEVM